MKKNKANERLRRKFYHWVIRKLVDNIEEYRNGFNYRCPDGVTRWMVPVLSYVITDWPEGQAMTLTGGHATESKANCRFCLHPTNIMGRTGEGLTFPRRIQEDSMELMEKFKHTTLELKRAKEVLHYSA